MSGEPRFHEACQRTMKISFLFTAKSGFEIARPHRVPLLPCRHHAASAPPRVKLENGPSEIRRIKIPDPIAEILRDEKWDIEEAEG